MFSLEKLQSTESTCEKTTVHGTVHGTDFRSTCEKTTVHGLRQPETLVFTVHPLLRDPAPLGYPFDVGAGTVDGINIARILHMCGNHHSIIDARSQLPQPRIQC